MTGIDERLGALSPQQRELLARRLQSTRASRSPKLPAPLGIGPMTA